MALGGGMSCVKYLLFCFNLLFAVTGLIILIVGARLQISLSPYVDLTEETFYESGPIVLIIVGVIVFIVAFFGCCGAFKENHCMIVTFAVFLLIIFVAELAVGIAGYMKHQALEDTIMRNLNSTIKEYPSNPDVKKTFDIIQTDALEDTIMRNLNSTIKEYPSNPDVKKTFDIIQTDLQCCGIYGPADWKNNSMPIPETCCAAQEIRDGGVVACDMSSANLHHKGCLAEVVNYLRSIAAVLGGVGLAIAVIQLLGVLFSCCLARSIRSQYETV